MSDNIGARQRARSACMNAAPGSVAGTVAIALANKASDCWTPDVSRARDILRDEFGHAEAQHNPAALEALAILERLLRD